MHRSSPLTPPQYLKAIWDVINFEEAESRFKAK
jgi:superoxide dismutase